jgi:hypothetical protein
MGKTWRTQGRSSNADLGSTNALAFDYEAEHVVYLKDINFDAAGGLLFCI